MASYQVDGRAYSIPLLHASKYPASDVCGALLGKVTQNGLEIKTAVPFFHHWTTLTPMLEVALQQTELYAKTQDLKIVGWYQANQRNDDGTLHQSAIKVAETILQHNSKAIIFVVKNDLISSANDESAIAPYINSDNQWQHIKNPFKDNTLQFNQDGVYAKLRGLVSSASYNRLHDFDEHLEDTSLDWLSSSKISI